MRQATVTIIALALFGTSVSTVCAGDRVYSSYAFSKRYDSTISEKRLSATPKWKADDENPPFSMRRAIRIADTRQKELAKDHDKGFEWIRTSATLVFDSDEKCFWQIHYEAHHLKPVVVLRPFDHLDLFVLMDGTLVEPKISEFSRYREIFGDP